MKIYIVRHGETDWNGPRRLQGRSDIPLNETGIEEAKITGEALKDVPFAAAFVSPLTRTRQTAGTGTFRCTRMHGSSRCVLASMRG